MKVYIVENVFDTEDRYGERDSFSTNSGVYMSAEKAKEKVEKSIAEKTFTNFTDYVYLDPNKIIGEPEVEFNPDYDPISCPRIYSIEYEDTSETEYYQLIYIREYEVI